MSSIIKEVIYGIFVSSVSLLLMYLAIIIFEEYNYFNLTEYISAGYIMVIPNTIIISMVFHFSKKIFKHK